MSTITKLNAEKEQCVEVMKVLQWDNVERYLHNNNLWHNPDILEMFINADVEYHNDSYAKIFRHNIKKESDLQLFDLICETFGIEHEIPSWSDGEDMTELLFWISW